MTVETDLYEALRDDEDVSEFVGTRIYPKEAAQGDTIPYIVYEVVRSTPIESPAENQETNESEIDIACYGNTYAEAKSLSQAVRSVLIQSFDASVIDDSRDERDMETRKKFVLQTYRIWHDESFP